MLVDMSDTAAIREMRELDGASDAHAIDEAKTLIRNALDPAEPRAVQTLVQFSDSVSGFPERN